MQACFGFLDREELTSSVSISSSMGDQDHKHQITLKLSSTIATLYLCLVCFWSATQRLLGKVTGLLKQKSGNRVKILAYFQHQSSSVYLNTTCQMWGALTPRNIVLWKTATPSGLPFLLYCSSFAYSLPKHLLPTLGYNSCWLPRRFLLCLAQNLPCLVFWLLQPDFIVLCTSW